MIWMDSGLEGDYSTKDEMANLPQEIWTWHRTMGRCSFSSNKRIIRPASCQWMRWMYSWRYTDTMHTSLQQRDIFGWSRQRRLFWARKRYNFWDNACHREGYTVTLRRHALQSSKGRFSLCMTIRCSRQTWYAIIHWRKRHTVTTRIIDGSLQKVKPAKLRRADLYNIHDEVSGWHPGRDGWTRPCKRWAAEVKATAINTKTASRSSSLMIL